MKDSIDFSELLKISRECGYQLAKNRVKRQRTRPRNREKEKIMIDCIVAFASKHIKKVGNDIYLDWL